MGRPKIKASKRRVQINISLSPEIVALAKNTDNASRFYESSVSAAQGLSIIMKRLERREIDIGHAIEELNDIAIVWNNNFEELIPFISSKREEKAV
jgi:hypothetical protein